MRTLRVDRQLVILGLLTVGVFASMPHVRARPLGTATVEAYTMHSYDGRQRQAELWKLPVPESRSRTSSVNVTIGFLRLKSTSPSPRSPIVFLMGGPGIPATVIAPIPPYWDLFGKLQAVSDVILLDQRGVGLSVPDLDCPPSASPSTSLLGSRAALVEAFQMALASCAATWRARGVDPSAYTEAASAADIEDVRTALGTERVNLLAFSYGTRLALDFARRYASHVDRMVLQGVEDADLRYRSSTTVDAVFDRYARLAAVDPATAPFAADLRARLGKVFTSLSRAPLVVQVPRPSGADVSIPVGKEGLQAIVSQRVHDPKLPALIATLERGDARILTPLVTALYNEIAGGGGSLMGRAIECSDPPSAARIADVDKASRGNLLGLLFDDAVVTPRFCAALGLADPTSHLEGPVPFAGPAVIIEGTLDDRTGGNAADVSPLLTGSVTLAVDNGAHELLPVTQVQDVVVEFFQGRDVSHRHLSVAPPRFLSLEAALGPAM